MVRVAPVGDPALGPSADGDVPLHIAFLWVESGPELPAGGRAPVRLLPLTPENWSHVAPGDVITMHERQPVAGTATITQVLLPQGAGPHRSARAPVLRASPSTR